MRRCARRGRRSLEAQARSTDYRVRAAGLPGAVGQFRFRQKLEVLSRRGLERRKPGLSRSSALHLARAASARPSADGQLGEALLHNSANADGNEAVRRLAILALETALLSATRLSCCRIGEEEGSSRDVRETAAKVAAGSTSARRLAEDL